MTANTVVVKLGGEVIASDALTHLAFDIAKLASTVRIVLVHGGGPQVTKLQERLGIPTRQIGGRRITDADTLEVIKMAIAGKLNVDLCAALTRSGVQAVGLHGASAQVIAATKRPARVYAGAGPHPIELGEVGDVANVNTRLLTQLTDAGYVPVLASIGCGNDGRVFNINADTVATRVALALQAHALVLVSDVSGVLLDIQDPSSRIPRITYAEAQRLIQNGVIQKGMIAKLEEAFAVLKLGVPRIHIVGQLQAGDLERSLRTPGEVGTLLEL